MGIKTEDMVRGLPPKVMTEGVDWLGILDSFNVEAIVSKKSFREARGTATIACCVVLISSIIHLGFKIIYYQCKYMIK